MIVHQRPNHTLARVAVAVVLACAPDLGQAQVAPEVVGTWRLVSMVRPDSTGQLRPVWDDRPSGLIIYTPDGHMAAQLYDSRRPRLGSRSDAVSPDTARTAFAGLVTYFGTYSVDRGAGTVTHTVEGAMTPDWLGVKLVRAFRFLTPDRLELRVVTDAAGQRVDNGSILTWQRVKR